MVANAIICQKVCVVCRQKLYNFLLQEIRDVAQNLGIVPTVIAGEDLKKGSFGGMLSTFPIT